MGPVLSRIWEVRRAEWSDVSTSDDGSSEHASHTQAEDEPSNGDRNSISILPDDLLLKIFSFLDVVSLCRCAQVSRDLELSCFAWKQLAARLSL
eukprot:Em0007g215a